MEERLAPEALYLRSFLRKLAVGVAEFDIDDLVQETMNRALRYRDSYDTARPLRQWLFSIGFRVFLDAREHLKRTPIIAGSSEMEEFAVALPSAGNKGSRIDVRQILAALEEPERGVMERTYLRSQSVREVAQALAMAEGTVKSHLHRARRRLAERFHVEDWL